MISIEESARKSPPGELTPAPAQGNGPAWEGKILSDGAVEGRAAEWCPKSVKLSDKRAKSPLPGAEASRYPTSSIDMLNDSLEPRGVSSPPFSSTNDASADLVGQSAGDEGGITSFAGLPETNCMATAVEGSTAAAQSLDERAAPCKDVAVTDGHDVEKNIHPDNAPPELKLGQSSSDGFHELLQAAMRQSDAERAQDRESARNFRRGRQSSPLEQQQKPVDQPVICTAAEPRPPTATGSGASVRSKVDCIPAGSVSSGNDAAVEGSNSDQSPSALVPTPQRDVAKPAVVRRQWVRYLSPEGYPYLYDEVTGDSEWDVSGEEEARSPRPQEPTGEATGDTFGGGMHGEPGDTRHALGERDARKDLLDTACVETGETGTTVHPAEGESVGTCEVSQWSGDTSGPDARWELYKLYPWHTEFYLVMYTASYRNFIEL